MGAANSKVLRTIPDTRLVEEGHYILDLPYMKLQANGDITTNVEDILFETKIDPFMTLLKNSSASEILGRFRAISTESVLASVGPELSALMAPELSSENSYFFQVNKGDFTLRNMAAVIDGNTVNSILFPTYSGALGMLNGSEPAVQDLLEARGYGQLRSDVFYFHVLDSARKDVTSFNGASMFIKVAYKGDKSSLNDINVVMADWSVTTVAPLDASSLLAIQPATADTEGYVIIKTTAPGYFVVSDK